VPPAGITPRTLANAVTPGYSEVMRIAILRGRGLTDADHETAPRVAVVNEAFARQYFAAPDALGRRVGLCSSEPCGSQVEMMTIVGVSEDAKYADLREPARPMLYIPFTQTAQNLRELQMRTAGDPAAVAPSLHRELTRLDPRMAVAAMMAARDQVDGSIVAERLVAKLSAAFGALALGLAVVGLYGLVAYVGAQRTAEIGIRMALGAGRADVRRLVVGETLRLIVAGLIVGVPAALAAARLLSAQLYEVAPTDPLALSAAVALLGAAAAGASYLPARRAARVDPCAALRAE
jgi:predicted permease